MKMTTILMTGAAGRIGTFLRPELAVKTPAPGKSAVKTRAGTKTTIKKRAVAKRR